MKRFLIALLIAAMLLTCSCTVNINVAEDPEDKKAIAEESEVTEPEVTEPEVVEPEVIKPEVTEPEAVEPEVVKPEATEPEATEPEVTEPEVVEPEVVKPEVVEPEVVEPEATIKPELTIMPESSPITVDSAEFVIFDGIMDDDSSIYHTFEPSIDGVYRFEICKLEGNKPNLYVSENGNHLANKAFAGENEGCTVSLRAGAVYSVEVKGTGCSYTLKVWKQKPTVDASEYTIINDSMEFLQQRNVYTFIPKIDGTYGVGIAESDEGIKVALRIEDAEGNLLSRSAGVGAGENIYADNFIGGKTYVIHVTQTNGYGAYALSLGLQQPTADISDYPAVNDCLVFTGQKNVYSFTAKSSAVYTFTLSYTEGYRHGMSIHVYDSEQTKITHHNYCLSGDSVSIKATAGQTYTISVNYYLLPTDYTLKITP